MYLVSQVRWHIPWSTLDMDHKRILIYIVSPVEKIKHLSNFSMDSGFIRILGPSLLHFSYTVFVCVTFYTNIYIYVCVCHHQKGFCETKNMHKSFFLYYGQFNNPQIESKFNSQKNVGILGEDISSLFFLQKSSWPPLPFTKKKKGKQLTTVTNIAIDRIVCVCVLVYNNMYCIYLYVDLF